MNPGESTNDEVEGAGKEWSKGKDMPVQRPMEARCPLSLCWQSIRVTAGGRTSGRPRRPVWATVRHSEEALLGLCPPWTLT